MQKELYKSRKQGFEPANCTKSIFVAGCFVVFTMTTFNVSAQTAPESFDVITETPAVHNYTVNGYGSTGAYPEANTYNAYFGKESAISDGLNRKITTIMSGGDSLFPINTGLYDRPFSRVVIKRVANTEVSDLGKQSLFYENAGYTAADVPADGSDIYHLPEFAADMETAINSFIFNRGSDNLFSNASGTTLNNIERVDLIRDDKTMTMIDPTRTDVGFVLMERGGNDQFKVAAITSLDITGNPASLGPLVNVNIADWGTTGVSFTSTVFMKNTADANLRPAQHVGSQGVYGVFISLADLGVLSGDTIYGVSLFPTDVDNTMDLLTLTDVPLNTNATGAGGLDFMAGGGLYAVNPDEFRKPLSGNVFHDDDGLTDSIPWGPGIGNIDTEPLYAYLLDEFMHVLKKVPVSPLGNFDFGPSLQSGVVYKVRISIDDMSIGDIAPETPSLPNGWVGVWDSYFNGENGYLNPTVNPGYEIDYTELTFEEGGSEISRFIQTGIPDLTINIMDDDFAEINVEFGIQKTPQADPKEFEIDNTAFSTVPPSGYPAITGYQSINITDPVFAGPSAVAYGSLSATDIEDCSTASSCNTGTGTTFNIHTINSNTKIYYDFGEGLGIQEIDVTGGVITIENFEADKMVIYAADGGGAIGSEIGFTYSMTDKADFKGDSVTYSIITPTPLPIELLSFTAIKQGKIAVLNWTTAKEKDNYGFEMEHSTDGKNWEAIGFEPSKADNGTSSQQLSYTYIHNAPVLNVNLYRLKQIDLNRAYQYSPTVKVVFNGDDKEILAFPSPAREFVTISGLEGGETLRIYSAQGALLGTSFAKAGSSTISIKNLAFGTYYLNIQREDGEQVNKKIIKQ